MTRLAFAALFAAVAGCAAPVFKATEHVLAATPADVQATPDDFRDGEVIWGGRVLEVRTLPDATEVDVVSFPLDATQAPIPDAPTQGRFVMILPRAVDPNDYPTGRYVTLRGRLAGTRAGTVQEREYVFPLVRADAAHLWPLGYMIDRPQWRVGVGVGVSVRH